MMTKKGWGMLLSAALFIILTAVPAFASTGNPATGDHSMIGVVAAVLVVSLLVITALVVVGIRKKGK
ncbi:MAG: LPXTG cell wall anchor domain-containing protein [Provencibacterium sp.]|nr:LPXTG cell wall anchor domain-containing protein [Provencibacterium sp.]